MVARGKLAPGVPGLTESLTEQAEVVVDFGVEFGGPAGVEVLATDVGGDDEAGRDGQAELGHGDEARALAAEQGGGVGQVVGGEGIVEGDDLG